MDNYRHSSVVRDDNAYTEPQNQFYTAAADDSSHYNLIAGREDRPVTAAEVERIIRSAISEMKIYVLEADITDAQNAVKAVVEKSRF